jgi:methyltransferase
VVSQALYTLLLASLGLERIYELSLSRRNAEWAKARGGVEYGQRHFVWMKLLHGAWFAGCLAEVWLGHRPFLAWLGWPLLGLTLLAQGLRYWAVRSLGPRWNVAVIVLPGVRLERGGPYRWLRHPNYLAVVIEGFAVPLIHSAYVTALAFTILNAVVLAVRIRCEEAALEQNADHAERFADRPRFWPRMSRRQLAPPSSRSR